MEEIEGKENISEADLDQLFRRIEEKNLTQEELSKVMKMIGGFLQSRPEKWLNELGTSVYQAASVRISPEYSLDHSLPDNGTRTVIVNTFQRTFEHSLVIERDEESENTEREEIIPPLHDSNDLEQSGVFEWEQENEAPILLPNFHHRHKVIEKIQRGLPIDDDERVRSAKTLSMTEIRRKMGSTIGEKAREIREHSFADESQLEETILKALKELKGLIDQLLENARGDLIRNRIPGTKIFPRFFQENGKTLDLIMEVNKAIDLLEEDCQEITEMKLEMEFLIDMLLGASEEYESWNKEKNKNDLYTQALRNTVCARVKAILHHEAEIHNRLTNIQSRFRELFKKIWKVKIHIPDPWAK